MNKENRGREEIHQGASKGRGKFKDMWGSLDKIISEVETSLKTLFDQVEDAHQQMGVMASDNDEVQDNVKWAINKLGRGLRKEMCGLLEVFIGEVLMLCEQVQGELFIVTQDAKDVHAY